MDKDKTLAEDGTEKKKLIIRLTEYEGNRLLDLRFWYFKRKEGEWYRTRKGIMLNRENFICAKKTFEAHDEEILDWLGIGYVPEHVEKYANEQEEAVEKSAYAPDMVSTSTAQQPRNPAFFEVVHRGGKTEVEYNESHPLFANLKASDDAAASRLLALLLASYHRAKERLGDSPATDASILFDQLEHNWSNYLRGYLTEKKSDDLESH
ncbi:transcriptional coactivator p15/PC4 family protein [Akkermansiaceae bacterium]|nr:transcriptional coactivator p15/PC4 family protein [bacterium]MDB4414036.1 transcriptional coactivator p15/PC4 family protein [Akkermansiaceae bacterium]